MKETDSRRFVTIFERYEQVHVNKDVGQVAKVVGECKGWVSEVWGESSYADVRLRKLKLAGVNLHAIIKLLSEAKKTEVLSLYHIRYYNIIYALIYKKLNPNGVVYVKGDFDLAAVKKNGIFYSRFKFIETFIENNIHSVDVVSTEQLSLLNKVRTLGCDAIYLPNSPSMEFSKIIDSNSRSESHSIVRKLLFVGRVGTYQKNVELLLDAINKLDVNTSFSLKIVGPIESGFKDKLDSGEILTPTNVEFTGVVSDVNEIAAYYYEADLLIMTSRYEGFPLCAVEAAYAECALLVNKNCGVDEIVEQGVNGYYYNDVIDLASKIKWFCNIDTDEIKRMKNASREKVEPLHWSKTVPLLVSRIESHINER